MSETSPQSIAGKPADSAPPATSRRAGEPARSSADASRTGPLRRWLSQHWDQLAALALLFAVFAAAAAFGLTWQQALVLGVLAGMIVCLFREIWSAEVVMLAALAILAAAGIVSVDQAIAGFANDGLVMIGALLVVGAGLRATGALTYIAHVVLGRPKGRSVERSMTRLVAPVALLSAFTNNTPLVAMLLPVVVDWAKRNRFSPSKFLIPLSYAAVLGGIITLIGTSTNLVVNGIIIQRLPDHPRGLPLFELAWVGLPVAVAGLLFLRFVAPRLLPDREGLLEHFGTHRREYVVVMRVEAGCPLVGQTLANTGLLDLPALELIEITRGSEVLAARRGERLRIGDQLAFSGILSTVVDLQKIRGLTAVGEEATGAAFDSLDSLEGVPPAPPPIERRLCEAVVSSTAAFGGQTIREANFRGRYGATVIAVHRSGERLESKLGDVVLRPGDTLLLEAPEDFVRVNRNSPNFYLVSAVADSTPPLHERAPFALTTMAVVIAGIALSDVIGTQPVIVALIGALLMVVTGCLSPAEARRAVDWQLLLLIGAALGVASAMETSGAAELVAHAVIDAVPASAGDWGVLIVLYGVTLVMTELLSNNATAALMATIAIPLAASMAVDPMPLLIAVIIASTCGFATPIGYQTNLMVQGPGGYRFADYFKVGLPLDLICWIVAVLVIPLVWPFR